MLLVSMRASVCLGSNWWNWHEIGKTPNIYFAKHIINCKLVLCFDKGLELMYNSSGL